ncbi:MAG: AAA family ATPase [Gammaproteobacteria bacterium]|nr:AAA family ATPase [Gammaproteobacteria bacterium]
MPKSKQRRNDELNMDWLSGHELPGSKDTRLLCRLWVFRMLFECGGIKMFLNNSTIHDEPKVYIGFNDDEFRKLKSHQTYAVLKERYDQVSCLDIKRKSCLFKNIKQIRQLFGLSKTDTEILTFACLVTTHELFGRSFDVFRSINNNQLYSVLSGTLNIPKAKITKALHKDGLLNRCGLVKVINSNEDLEFKFDILDGLCHALETKQSNVMDLFSAYISQAHPAKLNMQDYSYIKKDFKRLKKYLKKSVADQRQGANVLLYGPPGTGKTELAHTLAKDCGIQLYTLSVESPDGNTLTGKQRISVCQLAQRLLRNDTRCCLLFDEIEDLFPNDLFALLSNSKKSGRDKAWVNQLLENNQVPTFWITNSINSLDNAFVRRFDYVLEMQVPPRSARRRILSKALENMPVSEPWLDSIAAIELLPPAVIERAVRVSAMIEYNCPQDLENNIHQVITNTLKAMGISSKSTSLLDTSFYDPSLLQTSGNLEQINTGLNTSKQGRLCFYGPPGTGKSAYAAYLAKSIDKPLLAKQASDIIDCYIGETEKNIARMFEQAADENCLLLLDEADSFLRDRARSRNSWEVTQVNELLVQMERFQGIFVCSTNLMSNLDNAVLRRFDFKLKFNYLKTNQVWKLFKRYMQDSDKEFDQCYEDIKTMNLLTPGDFATAHRKLTVLGTTNQPAELIKALKEELKFKQTLSRPIGFTTTH